MEGRTKLLLVVVVAATALSASLETVFDNKLGEKRKEKLSGSKHAWLYFIYFL